MDGQSLIKEFQPHKIKQCKKKANQPKITFRVNELITHWATLKWKMISQRIQLRESVITADMKDIMLDLVHKRINRYIMRVDIGVCVPLYNKNACSKSRVCVSCKPLILSWFVIMLMLDLDLCNECNDLVGFPPQLHLVYRPKV